MFDQPVLEGILRANLARYASVTVRANSEVTDVIQDGAGRVRVEVTDRVTGRDESILAEYVLGCDGANSLIRSTIGACLQDLHLEQRWLVVDVDTDADLAQWEGVHQAVRPVPCRHLYAGRRDPVPLGVPAAARGERGGLPRPGRAAPADLPVDR